MVKIAAQEKLNEVVRIWGKYILDESAGSGDDGASSLSGEMLAHLSGDGDRIVAVMTAHLIEAYLDESGTHRESPILAVAGYFGTHDDWQVFLEHWKHKEFHARKSRFRALRAELANAIDLAGLHGVCAYVKPEDFKAGASSYLKSVMGNAYAFSTWACANRICNLVKKRNPHVRVAFVLEDGQPNAESLQTSLIETMRMHPIASVTVAKKGEFIQLHAADFLAYSRSTTNAQWLDRICATRRVIFEPIDQEVLERISSSLWKAATEFKRNRLAERRIRSRQRKHK